MASVILHPNGDDDAIWTPSSGTTRWQLVDEAVASHDGASTEITTTGTTGQHFTTDNVPADFASVNTLQQKVVAKQSGRVDDTAGISVNLFEAGTGSELNTALEQNLNTVTTYTTYTGTASISAAWGSGPLNTMIIRVGSTRTNSGMADSVTWYCTAVEVVMDYTASGPATEQPYYVRTGGVPGMRIGRPGSVFGRSWMRRHAWL